MDVRVWRKETRGAYNFATPHVFLKRTICNVLIANGWPGGIVGKINDNQLTPTRALTTL